MKQPIYTQKRMLDNSSAKLKAGYPSFGLMLNVTLVTVFGIALVYAMRYFLFDKTSISLVLLSPFIFLPILLKIFIHLKWHRTAQIVGLLGFNLALFFVAASESRNTGVYLHFISAGSMAIAIFRYKQRYKSLFFIFLSTCLFLTVHFVEFSFIPFRHYTIENEQLFFVLHTVGAAIISGSGLILVMGRNHKLQKYLNNNQRIIEAQNQQLRKNNHELDRFVYSVTHDLKAPLSSIKGIMTLLELDHETPAKTYHSEIINQIEVMDLFIDKIVDNVRNEHTTVSLVSLNLNEFVSKIINSLSHVEYAAQQQIINEVDENLEIKTDPHRLSVILSNLISNSIKYCDLDKKNPFVKVSVDSKETGVTIQISDNGFGIEEKHLPHIFDKFYQASNASKGSGLGLNIVKEATNTMGYDLDVKSVFGEGTMFTVTIPN